MAKPKKVSVGGFDIQYTSVKERNEKVFEVAADVFSRLNSPIVVLRVPWNKGTNEYEGYLIQPMPHGWTVFKMEPGRTRCLALLNNRTREEVLYEWLQHEAWTWFDLGWDVDSYKRYRDTVEKWVAPYVGQGQAIVFAAELDKRRQEALAEKQRTNWRV